MCVTLSSKQCKNNITGLTSIALYDPGYILSTLYEVTDHPWIVESQQRAQDLVLRNQRNPPKRPQLAYEIICASPAVSRSSTRGRLIGGFDCTKHLNTDKTRIYTCLQRDLSRNTRENKLFPTSPCRPGHPKLKKRSKIKVRGTSSALRCFKIIS